MFLDCVFLWGSMGVCRYHAWGAVVQEANGSAKPLKQWIRSANGDLSHYNAALFPLMYAAFKLIPVNVKIMMGSPAAKWLRKNVRSATGATPVGHVCLISGGVRTNRNVQAEVDKWQCIATAHKHPTAVVLDSIIDFPIIVIV